MSFLMSRITYTCFVSLLVSLFGLSCVPLFYVFVCVYASVSLLCVLRTHVSLVRLVWHICAARPVWGVSTLGETAWALCPWVATPQTGRAPQTCQNRRTNKTRIHHTRLTKKTHSVCRAACPSVETPYTGRAALICQTRRTKETRVHPRDMRTCSLGCLNSATNCST